VKVDDGEEPEKWYEKEATKYPATRLDRQITCPNLFLVSWFFSISFFSHSVRQTFLASSQDPIYFTRVPKATSDAGRRVWTSLSQLFPETVADQLNRRLRTRRDVFIKPPVSSILINTHHYFYSSFYLAPTKLYAVGNGVADMALGTHAAFCSCTRKQRQHSIALAAFDMFKSNDHPF